MFFITVQKNSFFGVCHWKKQIWGRLGLGNMTFTNFFSVLMASESSWVHSYQMHDLWLMYSLEDKFPFFKSDGKKTFQAAKTEKCGRFILLLSSVGSSFSLSIICSLLSLCRFFLCGSSLFVSVLYLGLFFFVYLLSLFFLSSFLYLSHDLSLSQSVSYVLLVLLLYYFLSCINVFPFSLSVTLLT